MSVSDSANAIFSNAIWYHANCLENDHLQECGEVAATRRPRRTPCDHDPFYGNWHNMSSEEENSANVPEGQRVYRSERQLYATDVPPSETKAFSRIHVIINIKVPGKSYPHDVHDIGKDWDYR